MRISDLEIEDAGDKRAYIEALQESGWPLPQEGVPDLRKWLWKKALEFARQPSKEITPKDIKNLEMVQYCWSELSTQEYDTPRFLSAMTDHMHQEAEEFRYFIERMKKSLLLTEDTK